MLCSQTMESEEPVRIFLPKALMSTPSGYLVGCQDVKKGMCSVTAVICASLTDIKKRCSCLVASKNPGKLAILGFVNSTTREHAKHVHPPSSFTKSHCWLSIIICDSVDISCQLLGGWKVTTFCRDPLLIFHNPQDLVMSVFLTENVSKRIADKSQSAEEMYGNVDITIKSLLMFNKSITSVYEAELSSFVSQPSQTKNWLTTILSSAIFNIFYKITYFISYGTQNRVFGNRLLRAVCEKPAVLCQLHQRYGNMKTAVKEGQGTPCQQLRFKNCASRQIFDVLLGICVMLIMMNWENSHCSIAEKIMSYADTTASELQRLLKWMMGVPAGLKLNSQLDQFLGRFFLYHIYLWTGYLQVLRPVLGSCLWYISLSGCLGFTTQLALIQDLLAMMTLHIYCFYVYAARLYSLQMLGLASLWRLFRGKKWNVLRRRLDSASFDVDQLVLGTLLFTILLFLLPTTALYYVVFTSLRLVVLVIQGTLHKIVTLLNILPLHSLIYRILAPERVSDGVYFTVMPTSQTQPLTLNMQLVPASLGVLWSHSSSSVKSPVYSWSDISHSLLWGKLIYPWIEQRSYADSPNNSPEKYTDNTCILQTKS